MRIMALALFTAVCTTIQAQEPFNTLFVEYNPTKFSMSYDGTSESINFTGLSVGYGRTSVLSGPLMIESALKVQYFTNKEKDGHHDVKTEMISATIPVSLTYNMDLGSGGFSLLPYGGVFARGNIWAQASYTQDDGEKVKMNLFDDEEEFNKGTLKRFNFGLQFGVKARIASAFMVGVGYWMDLNEIAEHTKMKGFEISAGLAF